MYCKKCGTENIEEANFCSKCGQELCETNVVCSNEQPKDRQDVVICNICGNPVNGHDFTNAFVFYKFHFLGVYFSTSYNRLFGCKSCIRNIIDKQTFRVDNVLFGNVCWLLIMLPTNLIAKSKCK